MNQYFAYFALNYSTLFIINLLLSSVVVILEYKRPTSALAWLFFLNLFPIIGFLFYILLSENIMRRKIFTYTSREMSLYSKLLSSQYEDFKFDGNSKISISERYREMIIYHNRLSEAFYSDNNQIKFYHEGQTKFDDLFNDVKNAKHHIHLLYYIVGSDKLSRQLIDLLCKKANQGVEVRFLIDHIGGRKLSHRLVQKMEDAGIQVSFFFPSRLKYINFKANYRNHRKIAVIDGNIGYIGGMNVGDEYIYSKRFGKWRDTHMRITGDAVISLQIRFILDWRAASKEFIIIDENYIHSSTEKQGNIGIQIVSSGPDDINDQIKQGYLKIINEATRYIYIQTPYFIPDSSIIDALSIAASSGIDVRIMIPNMPDHPFVYTATKAYCMDMLDYGIKTYMYNGGFLHSKGIISDDCISSYGSCNFDIRSFRLNFEANAFIYDENATIELREQFERDLENSTEITMLDVKNQNILDRFRSAVARLFSPIL